VPVELLTYISVAKAFIHTVDARSIDPREQTWLPAIAPPFPFFPPQTSNLGCVFSFMSLLFVGVPKLVREQLLAYCSSEVDLCKAVYRIQSYVFAFLSGFRFRSRHNYDVRKGYNL
jgi:hypothetical protein